MASNYVQKCIFSHFKQVNTLYLVAEPIYQFSSKSFPVSFEINLFKMGP